MSMKRDAMSDEVWTNERIVFVVFFFFFKTKVVVLPSLPRRELMIHFVDFEAVERVRQCETLSGQ